LIPSPTTSIGNGIFSYCTKLTSFIVQSGNKRYSSYNNLIYSLNQDTIIMCPNGYVGNIVIPNSVTSIANNAFEGCSLLTGNLTIPNSVTSIGEYAFAGFSSVIGTLLIPNAITSIANHAFEGCSSLNGNLTIPNSVTSIGFGAFADCQGLTSITIPNSVTTIDTLAFAFCFGLSSIYANSTIPINLNSSPDVFYYDNKTLTGNDKTVTLYVPVGSKSAYQVANQWSDFQNIVEFSPSAIDNPSSSKLTVSLQNGQLQLNGATVGDELSIYTLQGTIAYNQKVDQETIKLHFHAHGVFIVSVGIQSIKVVN